MPGEGDRCYTGTDLVWAEAFVRDVWAQLELVVSAFLLVSRRRVLVTCEGGQKESLCPCRCLWGCCDGRGAGALVPR